MTDLIAPSRLRARRGWLIAATIGCFLVAGASDIA